MASDPETAATERRIPCAACAEPVLPDARKCRWCGEWFADLVHRPARASSLTALQLHERGAIDGYEPAMPDDQVRALLAPPRVALEVAAESDVIAALVEAMAALRRAIAADHGVLTPQVVVRASSSANAAAWRLLIGGEPAAAGSIDASRRDAIVEEVTRGVRETLGARLHELLTREEVAALLEVARHDAPMVVQELVPGSLSLGQLRQVLQQLVEEQVPIRDLPAILNALADQAVYTKDPRALTEHVRAALGRAISARYRSGDGTIRAFLLSANAERVIQNAIQLNETGQVLVLDPITSAELHANLDSALASHRDTVETPIVVTDTRLRRHVAELLRPHVPRLVVLGRSELASSAAIDELATIDIDTAVVPTTAPARDWLIREAVEVEQGIEPAGDAGDGADWNW